MPASDFLIKTGDQAFFNPGFGIVLVTQPQPGTIIGTGRILIDGVMACVVGDEASVIVANCPYVSPVHSTPPGFGILTIAALNPDQIAKKTAFVGKAGILKGTFFTARFTPTIRPTTPAPASTPDPTPFYTGTGYFTTTNVRSKGF